MCAIVGVYSPDGKAAYHARNILHFQQNRGQQTTGIYAVNSDGKVTWRKGEGKVLDVFGRYILPANEVRGNVSSIEQFVGANLVGHTRYVTSGKRDLQPRDPVPADNAQPFVTENARFKVTLAYNGHVNNCEDVSKTLSLEARMTEDASLRFKSDNDAVPLMYVFADGLLKHSDPMESILQGAADVMEKIRGAYTISAVVHHKESGKTYQVAFKDPRGIRPGFFGTQNGSIAISSETYALERTKFWDVRPIKNGEVLIINDKGIWTRKQLKDEGYQPCQFEDAYFSRAFSTHNGRSINHGRFREGLTLARKILREKSEWLDDLDFVTYLPHTPMPIAKGVAKGLRLDFKSCIEKDLYDYQREFILNPDMRHVKTQLQSYVHWDAVSGKSFILIDDSIIRGDTMRNNIAMLREAGAERIFIGIGHPRVEYTCDLGIDMKTRKELVAFERNNKQIAEFIGADDIIYLTQPEYAETWDKVAIDAGLRRKVAQGIFNSEILEFVSDGKRCAACVTGKNPTHD
jgi:amidophosphoribosyltransferase